MIVRVVTDIEMTVTGDLLKIAWQNNEIMNNEIFSVSIPLKKKIGYGPLQNSGEQSRAILVFLC